MIMCDYSAFGTLLGRVRAGDEGAAAELVRCYEPALQREVQARLSRAQIRPLLDSQDVCQMVWAGFFSRLGMGGYELDWPGQLRRLLKIMARNLLLKEVAKLQTQRRGGFLTRQSDARLDESIDHRPGPVQVVIRQELRQVARRLLSRKEWKLVRLRARGRTWPEIATALGGRSDALRMRMTRAYHRIAGTLGLDESGRVGGMPQPR